MRIRTLFYAIPALVLAACGGGGGGEAAQNAEGKAVLVPEGCADSTVKYQWGDTTQGGDMLEASFTFSPNYAGSNEGTFTATIIHSGPNNSPATYSFTDGKWYSTPATANTVNIYNISAENTEIILKGNMRLQLLEVQQNNEGTPTTATAVIESGKLMLTFRDGPTYAPTLDGTNADISYTAQ